MRNGSMCLLLLQDSHGALPDGGIVTNRRFRRTPRLHTEFSRNKIDQKAMPVWPKYSSDLRADAFWAAQEGAICENVFEFEVKN